MIKKNKNLSLRIKAIVFAIALSTIPVILTGTMTYVFATENLTDYVIKYQESRAISTANEVSNFLFERYLDVKELANLAILNDSRVSKTTSTSQKQALLDKYVKEGKGYDSIAVADVKGNTILQSSGEPITDLGEREYFQEVIKTNRPTIVQPRKSFITGEYAIFAAAPVVDINTGKTIAVIRTRTPTAYLNRNYEQNQYQLTQNSETLRKEEYHLIDGTGKFFSATESEQVSRDAGSDFSVFAKLQAQKKINSVIDIDRIDGAKQLITYAPIETSKNLPALGWSVIIANDTKDVFAPQKDLLYALMTGVGITAAVVSAIATFLANRTTRSVNGIVRAIASSSSQIAVTVEQQERIASQQLYAVDRTASTMEELGESSKACASQAEAAAFGAAQALELTAGGSQAVDNTLKEIATLAENVGAIQKQILRLSEQTDRIGNISTLVSDLANQTNMLAINAAVEAVRAGESGKGFAVVATEIRKLADKSKESASKINALVADIHKAIVSTTIVTDDGTKTVKNGVKIARKASDAFAGVAEAIDRIVLNSKQISFTARNQALAIEDVVESVNSLNLAAQETASGISQVKLGISQLDRAAQNLKSVV
ncbi:methyl-accepting chemotaxis protein [Microcoleus sp. LEGE 07076]|uniref:methyl-accepting chemotaxis protein n=1 Tax=Microcoleus sp. LEGE 07076 TaxID=915322 RepID=UPI00187EA54C|nr:methyl-accepting chemotaxis protein [Microcoleus sp. LEGE 07076]MBE9184059.1 methyl-accepting chemotaxis protein [Microcoleus sp. LEGE 07076]